METKFIITADKKHFKSDCEDHQVIARHNGYNTKEIVETGIIIEHKLFILECYNSAHRDKIAKIKFISSEVDKYIEKLADWKKGREAETRYKYKRPLDGD